MLSPFLLTLCVLIPSLGAKVINLSFEMLIDEGSADWMWLYLLFPVFTLFIHRFFIVFTVSLFVVFYWWSLSVFSPWRRYVLRIRNHLASFVTQSAGRDAGSIAGWEGRLFFWWCDTVCSPFGHFKSAQQLFASAGRVSQLKSRQPFVSKPLWSIVEEQPWFLATYGL